MNPLAVVTGASSGIGRAYAIELATRGYDLVIVARSEDKLGELAEGIHTESGVNVTVHATDLTLKKGLRTLLRYLKDKPVDLLVNNAGVATLGPFSQREPARLEEEVMLNVNALVQITRAVLPGMLLRQSGQVINIASSAAFQPLAYFANYAATKAHVLSLTQALNDEVGNSGVFLQAVCPGPVDTGFDDYAVDGHLSAPRSLFIQPETVVRQSLKDLEKRREISVPALHHRLLFRTGRLLPTSVSRVAARLGGRQFFE
ncbi:MAG: SDR family NAD(P)-dependent oxidoreductase [Pseudomonadota bacterium]